MFKRTFWLLLILGTAAFLMAQDFYEIETVNEIRLYFESANWSNTLHQLYAQGEERLVGNAIINGVAYDSVGVRYKGNSSYHVNRTKNPFNIKLNYIHDDQKIGPYGTLKLANGYSDPSFVRETLAYEIAAKYMPASKANYANLYVNDTLIGVYTAVQDVNSYYMSQHLKSSGHPRFKCNTNTMNPVVVWGYLGENPSAYEQYYELKSDEGWETLINFTNVLQNNPQDIAEVMNVDRNLWFCVFQNLLVNLDSPINIFHNFYLFGDADERINPIIWDLNMAFGGFMGSSLSQMQQLNPLRNASSNTFLLLKNVLSNPRYKKQYIAHMRTMLTENFSNGWYATRAAELQEICRPHVQADPNFLYSVSQFESNLNNSVSGSGFPPMNVPGITQLMDGRANYLLSNSNFAGTVPQFIASTHGDNPQAGLELEFTVTVQDANYVQIGIRQNTALKFNYHPMELTDAAQGLWTVSVPIQNGDIEYFFWAENDSQGMFYPARAEHEFFTIPLFNTRGDILINEIMAKNASFLDPFGEADDWVELYNPNDYPIDIGGMYMTDDHYASGIDRWTQIPEGFPEITTIPAGGYLILWFDEDLDQGPLHINDKLGGGADAVYLIDSDGETVIDTFAWTADDDLNVNDRSIGRYPDGSDNWILFGAGQDLPCTPGEPNYATSNQDAVAPALIAQIKAYPNPMRSKLNIELDAPKSDTKLRVYNLKGQLVQELESSPVQSWDGIGKNGESLPNGIYFIRAKIGKEHLVKKICIMR